MHEVIFQFESEAQVAAYGAAGESLLEVARTANVAIDAPCSGNGSCGKCRVRLVAGELESPKTAHITQEDYDAGWRLACVSKLVGDVTVLVPDIASAYRSRMKTADLSSGAEVAVFEKCMADIAAAGIGFQNPFETVALALDAPSLDDTMPDNERLSRALCAKTGAKTVKIPFACMQKLPRLLRDANFALRCAGLGEADTFVLMDVTAANDPAPLCAAAVDIGTTTVSAVLADLETGKLLAKASSGNGQIRYGADVINRIVEQGKPGGIRRLQAAIVEETLNPILDELCKTAKISPLRLVKLCIASNTTMNHLLVGLDAEFVRTEPYIPAFFSWKDLKAADLSLSAHPEAAVVLAPNIGSYVGGDITAGTLASMLWNQDDFSLFVDLGTNGEIVFGNRDFMMSCACSAGPAFEGGDISCGMRATDGAVEAVTLDCQTLEPTLSVIGNAGQKPVGLCGSGIIDMISELYRCGAISAKGQFVRENPRIVHDRHGTGRYLLATAAQSETGREVALDEVDISNFIRAKGAIFSAIDVLLTSLDMDVSMLARVYVAGGIGSGINMQNAVNIGMFPDIGVEKYHYIGNSSLAGAYAMAISRQAEEKVEDLAANMTYVELSTNPTYMDAFVAACFIPHTDAARFPSCRQEA